jgi:aspartyl-tRNA(Asn)/glutamyl-tRNA(Gln) amidotransferase subunit B
VAKEKTGVGDDIGMSPPGDADSHVTVYEIVIGLEVHAQLLTRTKMFCGCSTAFGAPPNTQTCPVCQGMPGTLPVINRRAVEFGIKTALAIGCTVSADNRFARKHYYYPDMPKNYQISQYEEPLAVHGHLDIEVGGAVRRIGIERLHLEEDVGKLIHEGSLETAQSSQVDFNRAGVPLMEIVSRPDMRTPEEAGAYLRGLRAILVYLGVCDGNMEEGSMRCDANISLKPAGATELGTKVEVKNMNSFRNVQHALEHEIKRQHKALEAGERIVQETRLWDPDKGHTVSMRSKEFAHDYRYFPEPDLPPLNVESHWIEEVRATLPELPAARRARFMQAHALNAYDADLLTGSRALADYFEATVAGCGKPKAAANWILNELLRELPGDDERAVAACPIPPGNLASLITLIEDGTTSGRIAKDVFEKMYRSGEDARTIISREGLTQVADVGVLAAKVDEVLSSHPKVVEDYSAGKKAALGFLIGQVMKSTGGKANPALVNRLLIEKLPKV